MYGCRRGRYLRRASWRTRARLWDRVIDGHVMTPMQKIVGDNLRPVGGRDPYGVVQARATLVHRWDEERLPDLTRYFTKLTARASVTRVIDEAREYRHAFPLPWPDYAA